MTRMFRTPAILTGLALSLTFLAACTTAAPEPEGGGEPRTLSLGHVAGVNAPYELASQGLAGAVSDATDGLITIETFPSAQLGGERDMVEQVQLGSLDMVVTSTGAVSAFVPELGGLELPYLFSTPEEAHAALDGELGAYFNDKIEAAGFINLGYWEFGFKNVTNSQRPIAEPADLAGLTMRVLENPILVDTYRALGADPTPIPFPETYAALQQGVVDGFEGPYINFVDGKLYEVQKFVSEIRINYGAVVLLINKELFESFTSEQQEAIRAAGAEWTLEQRRINAETAAEFKAFVETETEIEIIEFDDLDIDAFRDATASVYDAHPEYAEMIRIARGE